MSSDPSGFEVRATELAPAFDLLAACAGPAAHERFLFEREGVGVASSALGGVGGSVVERATEPQLSALASETLSRLRSLPGASTGPGPVAVGQFAFSHRGPAWTEIPPRLVRRTGGGAPWLVDVHSGRGEEARFDPVRPVGGAPAEPFDPGQVTAVPSPSGYEAMVSAALDRMADGPLRKVVLARTMEVEAGRTVDPVKLAHRLRAVDPQAFTFVAPDGMPGEPRPTLVGASPELLVAKRGRSVRSTPLAGSAPRAGDPEEDRKNAEALLASTKDREEHAIVVEAIEEVLSRFCEQLAHDPEPVLVETANVWHLATRFEGVLRDPAPSVVDLVAALHPTPAVCGTPTELARRTIEELEPFGRGGYAGPVGWMDVEGDGEWAIALRCARLDGEHATLFAGAGIVSASVPSAELSETDRKFRAFLDSLRWG